MKDISIKLKTEKTAVILPLTAKAKKVFKEHKCPDGMEGAKKDLHNVLSWAASHDLTIDTTVEIVVPQRPFLTQEEMIKAFPTVPKTMLPRKQFAMGMSKFKGDIMPDGWSVNSKFKKGQEYPVYEREGFFVVGNDGGAYSMTPTAWTKIKPF